VHLSAAWVECGANPSSGPAIMALWPARQWCGADATVMTADLWALLAALLLATIQLTIASVLTLRQLGSGWVAGPRDEPREVAGTAGRFVRAHRNLLEIFPQFVAALFLVHAAHAAGSLSAVGAWLFVIARLLYVPAYAFAPPGVRPICWVVAWLGIFLIVADLFV
jgi:uncharacterized MAPEG superfamily protein